MRALAALWVYCVHCMMSAVMPPEGTLSAPWLVLRWIFRSGTLGVNVFFVLSGFLITSLLLMDRDQPSMLHNFYWKRVLRIQPVFLLYLAATWFLVGGSHAYVLLSLLFVVNLTRDEGGPAWTLAIEEQFYLLWPQVVKRCSRRAVGATAMLTFLGSVLLRSIFFAATGHINLKYTPYQLDGLALGALLALQYMAPDEESPAVQVFLRALHSRMVITIVLLSTVYLSLPLELPSRILSPAFLLTNLLTYYVIRWVLLHPGNTAFACLRGTALRWVGDISYSFYLFHVLVLVLWARSGPQVVFGSPAYCAKFFACIGLTFLLCVVLRWSVELPAQRLRRSVLHSA